MMVKTMTSSLRVPHMVYSDEINVNALTEVRDSLRPLYANHSSRDRNNDKNAERKKLTYMPFFVKAASLALSEYPALNSTIDVEGMTLTYHGEHRIGIAVDTPRGLAVPVIGGCQDRSVLEIAEELNRLYSLVRD
jgi:2-oxoisovalerate dehydrogenase E2 component (dihydrolipoyl transacylase)